MAFNTLVFLLFFLPLSLILFYLPWGKKNGLGNGHKVLLIVLSLLFYSWGEPRRVLLLIVSVLVNYFLFRLWSVLQKKSDRSAFLLLCAAVVLNIAVLTWGKYLADSLPLGLSFYTFKILSAWFDRNRLRKTEEPDSFNLLNFANYITFFPQVISGPISRYDAFVAQKPKADFGQIAAAVPRFMAGLFVKILLADQIFAIRERLLTNAGSAEAWLAAFLYTLYIYLDFSSYSDMAISLGKMFGYETPENFRLPYLADSVADFWRRWHISLSSWFRDYVYIPLGGNRKGKARQILNICIVWALTGIWHGNQLNFLFWGLYYAVWLLLERFVLNPYTSKLPLFLRRLGTFVIVYFGWILFAFSDFSELAAYVGTLFGANGAGGEEALYLLRSAIVILILSVLVSFGVFRLLADHWKKSKLGQSTAGIALEYVAIFALFVLTVAFMLDQSFASFLYFNF